MSKIPPIPPEQRPFAQGEREDGLSAKGDPTGRRDAKTGLQSNEPGDGDVNLNEQGRQGNIRQNLTPRASVQDR